MSTTTPADLHRAALAAEHAAQLLDDARRDGDVPEILAARERLALAAKELAALRSDGRHA